MTLKSSCMAAQPASLPARGTIVPLASSTRMPRRTGFARTQQVHNRLPARLVSSYSSNSSNSNSNSNSNGRRRKGHKAALAPAPAGSNTDTTSRSRRRRAHQAPQTSNLPASSSNTTRSRSRSRIGVSPTTDRLEAEAAVQAAAAAAAAAATAVDAVAASLFNGSSKVPRGSLVFMKGARWRTQVAGRDRSGAAAPPVQVTCGSCLEAACVADLARIALLGRTAAAGCLNFPVEVYTEQQVAAVAALIQVKRPDMQMAEGQAAVPAAAGTDPQSASQSSTQLLIAASTHKMHLFVAEQAMRQAVAASASAFAAERAAALAVASPHHPAPKLKGIIVSIEQQDGFKRSKPWRMRTRTVKGLEQLTIMFASELEAACAYDLAWLASRGLAGGLETNFTAEVYSQEWIAAMAAYLRCKYPGAQLAAGV